MVPSFVSSNSFEMESQQGDTPRRRNRRQTATTNIPTAGSQAPVDPTVVLPSNGRQERRTSCLNYHCLYGYVVSNEYGSLTLSQELPLYENRINPEHIRDLWMIAAYPKSASEHASDDLELERVIQTLRSWNCRSIQRAVLYMFCFSQNTWFTNLAHIARNSLAHLSLLTVAHRNRVGTALMYILTRFPQLHHLYFGTHCHTVAYFKQSTNEDPTTRYSIVSTWDPVYSVAVPLSFRHINLAILHLESDDYYEPGWFEENLFQCLPRLESLRFTGEIYHSKPEIYGNYPGFYSQLLRYCSLLTSFRYDHRTSLEYIHGVDPDRFRLYEEPSVLNNHFTQQIGNLVRRFQFTSACNTRDQAEPIIVNHFRGILSTCSRTLTEMKLVLLHYDFLDYACQFNYPKLVHLDLFLNHPRSRLIMANNPYYFMSPTNQWADLLRRMPGLLHLILMGVIPREGAVDMLESILPQLASVRLDWKDYPNIPHHEVINMRERRGRRAGNT